PVALGMRQLYVWVREGAGHKQGYLNVPFFLARAAVYFAVWLLFTTVLDRWARRYEREGGALPRRVQLLSAWGLVAYGLTITLASIDWTMSLEPEWYSTIYPVLFATGQVLSGMAFALPVLLLLARQPAVSHLLSPQRLRDLGNLLLAFVMLWAYMSI